MKQRVRGAIFDVKADKHCILQTSKDGRCFIKGDFYMLLDILRCLERSESPRVHQSKSSFSESVINTVNKNFSKNLVTYCSGT